MYRRYMRRHYLLGGWILACLASWWGPAQAGDNPVVTVKVDDSKIKEGGSTKFIISCNPVPPAKMYVFYVLSGTASQGSDYSLERYSSVTFPAGASSVEIKVTAFEDSLVEDTETVILTLNDVMYATYYVSQEPTIGSPSSATLKISDVSAGEAKVWVTASDPNAAEVGGNTGAFTINCNGYQTTSLTVNFTLSGTADSGDYNISSRYSATIPAGAKSATLIVSPIADSLTEGVETVVLTLQDGTGYQLNVSSTSATVTISDTASGGQTQPSNPTQDDPPSQTDPTPDTRGADPVKLGQFVTRLYQLCLLRQPDSAGLAAWTNRLMNGESTGEEVAAGFLLSAECQARGLSDSSWLDMTYAACFDRGADAAGKDAWLTRMAAGDGRSTVTGGFTRSVEFVNLCTDYGVAAYVDPHESSACLVAGFYRIFLLREPDDAGLNNLVKKLKCGACTGAGAAKALLFSAEFASRNLSDEEFVALLYEGLLNRADVASNDFQRQFGWLSLLAKGQTRQDIVDGFTQGAEFVERCEKCGINAF